MFLSWSPSFSLPALPFFLSLSFAFLSFFLSCYLRVCVYFSSEVAPPVVSEFLLSTHL